MSNPLTTHSFHRNLSNHYKIEMIMFCPPYLLKVSHDLPLFSEYYQGPKFHLPSSAYSFSFCISTHFHSVRYIVATLALCLSSKLSRCVISLTCLSSWLPSYVDFWFVFIINNNLSQKRSLRVYFGS